MQHYTFSSSFTTNCRKSQTMDSSYPKIEISNQLRARCCGRVAMSCISLPKKMYTRIYLYLYLYIYIYISLSLSIYMYIYTTISQTRYGMFESFSSKFRGYSPLNFEPFDVPLWVLEDLKISNLYSFAGCGSIGSDHTSSVASKVHFARHCAQCKLEAMECCRILC